MKNDRQEKWNERLKKQKERVQWVIRGIDFDKLNDWEKARLEEWEQRIINGHWLSDRIMEIIEKIYREKGQ